MKRWRLPSVHLNGHKPWLKTRYIFSAAPFSTLVFQLIRKICSPETACNILMAVQSYNVKMQRVKWMSKTDCSTTRSKRQHTYLKSAAIFFDVLITWWTLTRWYMPLNDIWNTWAESGNDTEEPTHRIGNNRLLTLIICSWGIQTGTQRKILRHEDDEELPHNIQVPKFWVTNFKKKCTNYLIPPTSMQKWSFFFFKFNWF